ncbi:hypothetical protein PMAYCL1PPCAC_08391, partial [Pristionchus mayeri]
KDEPIDDFAEYEQEMPIADMYCPSTGISRPLDVSTGIPCLHVENKLSTDCGKKRMDLKYRANIDEEPFTCPYCDNVFWSRGGRSNHIRSIHHAQPYVCITCDQRFEKHFQLNYHIFINEGHRALSEKTQKRFSSVTKVVDSGRNKIMEYPVVTMAETHNLAIAKQEEPIAYVYPSFTYRPIKLASGILDSQKVLQKCSL